MKLLKWLKAGWKIVCAIEELTTLHDRQTVQPVEIQLAIDDAVKAVEAAADIDLPDELIARIVEADVKIIQEYYTVACGGPYGVYGVPVPRRD